MTPEGTAVTVCHGDETARLAVPFIGAHHAATMLAAAAVGREYGLSWAQIAAGLAAMEPLPGRTRLLEGANGSRLLDDSYNANPASTLAALDALAALPAARRLVMLGDMAELGDAAEESHLRVGRRLAEVAEVLVARGELARLAAEEARRCGLPDEAVHVTDRPEDAVALLRGELRSGDLLLLKGIAEARPGSHPLRGCWPIRNRPRRCCRGSIGAAQVRLEPPPARPGWRSTWTPWPTTCGRLAAGVGPREQVMAEAQGGRLRPRPPSRWRARPTTTALLARRGLPGRGPGPAPGRHHGADPGSGLYPAWQAREAFAPRT